MIDTILEFTENSSFDSFSQDRKTQFAVIRAFEILGEAAKKIPHKSWIFWSRYSNGV